jgi:DnaJ-class molecular chaperone
MSHTTTEAVCPHCDGYGFRMVGVNRACCDVCEGRSTVPARDRATIAANIE